VACALRDARGNSKKSETVKDPDRLVHWVLICLGFSIILWFRDQEITTSIRSSVLVSSIGVQHVTDG
jgi:hypothetical protein